MRRERSTGRKRTAPHARKLATGASSESIAALFESLHASAHRRAGAGTWVWDSASDVIRGSDEALQIAALDKTAMRLSDLIGRLDERDRPNLRALIDNALSGGSEFETDVRLSVGGMVRTVRVFAKRESPSSRRLVGTVEDITVRRSADAALLVLSTAVEQSPDHICVAALDGTLEYVNPAFHRDAGSPAPRHLSAILGGTAGFEEAWRAVNHGTVYRRVLERSRNGSVGFEEITVAPVRDAAGEVTNLIAIGMDVTERRRVDQDRVRLQTALARAASEWRHTVDLIDSAIVLFDTEATVRRLNRTALDLLALAAYEEIVGAPAAALPDSEPWRTVRSYVETLAATSGKQFHCDVHDPASGRTWQVVARSAADPERLDGVVVVITDITATVHLNESLRRSETMSALGTLVGGVAHEARNPLFGLSVTLDALETKVGTNGDLARYIGPLRREIDQLNTLMRDLLDYGRPRALDLQQTRIGDIVAAALESCLSIASARGVAIENLVATDCGPCLADPLKMQQVVRNLLENAIQHSASGTTVTITVTKESDDDGAWLVCSVRDRGPGFAEADLPHVFEPFFSRRAGGTGLGLSIVQRTMDQHGGCVRVRNHPEGGAMVTIEIPAFVGQES